MANLVKYYLEGAGFSAAFGSELNSLGSGSYVASSVGLSNSGLDLYLEFEFALTTGSATASSGNLYVSLLFQYLGQDGSTYRPSGFATSSPGAAPNSSLTGPPYWRRNMPVQFSTTSIDGFVDGVRVPPSGGRLVLGNNTGQALAASPGNTYYRLYTLNLNG